MHIIAVDEKYALWQGGNAMNKKNFCIGMGMGLMIGGISAMVMQPKKKRCMKSMVGRTLRSMGDVADSVSDIMGW